MARKTYYLTDRDERAAGGSVVERIKRGGGDRHTNIPKSSTKSSTRKTYYLTDRDERAAGGSVVERIKRGGGDRHTNIPKSSTKSSTKNNSPPPTSPVGMFPELFSTELFSRQEGQSGHVKLEVDEPEPQWGKETVRAPTLTGFTVPKPEKAHPKKPMIHGTFESAPEPLPMPQPLRTSAATPAPIAAAKKGWEVYKEYYPRGVSVLERKVSKYFPSTGGFIEMNPREVGSVKASEVAMNTAGRFIGGIGIGAVSAPGGIPLFVHDVLTHPKETVMGMWYEFGRDPAFTLGFLGGGAVIGKAASKIAIARARGHVYRAHSPPPPRIYSLAVPLVIPKGGSRGGVRLPKTPLHEAIEEWYEAHELQRRGTLSVPHSRIQWESAGPEINYEPRGTIPRVSELQRLSRKAEYIFRAARRGLLKRGIPVPPMLENMSRSELKSEHDVRVRQMAVSRATSHTTQRSRAASHTTQRVSRARSRPVSRLPTLPHMTLPVLPIRPLYMKEERVRRRKRSPKPIPWWHYSEKTNPVLTPTKVFRLLVGGGKK